MKTTILLGPRSFFGTANFAPGSSQASRHNEKLAKVFQALPSAASFHVLPFPSNLINFVVVSLKLPLSVRCVPHVTLFLEGMKSFVDFGWVLYAFKI